MTPTVRRLGEFRPLNLARLAWPIEGFLAMVFGRNVLMHLDTCHRQALTE